MRIIVINKLDAFQLNKESRNKVESLKIKEAAQYVYAGEKNKREIVKLTQEQWPDLSVETAYQIQQAVINLRQADGHHVFAPKMGLTSKAKWEQMGVDSPIVGYVFDDMLETKAEIKVSDYIHPKIEPEIAFVMKEELSGDVTLEEVLAHTDYVLSAAEVIDSRYLNFDFTLTDVIADNTSASGTIFGQEKFSVASLDLAAEKVVIKVNGDVKVEGSGADVLGHPALAIVELAKHLAKEGKSVPTGVPIMTGGMSSAVLLEAGDEVEIVYTNLETIQFKVLT